MLTSYEKMPERLKDLGLDEGAERRLRGARWVVTEKVHGANFVVMVGPGGVRFAKRKAPLRPGENFFGHLALVDELTEAGQSLWAALQGPKVEQVAVYGELFGGHYPHKDVAPVPGVQAIQTGVWYCPEVRFCAFDIAVTVGGDRSYLDYERTLALAADAGLFAAAPLAVGTLQEAMELPVEFDTTVPDALGLPAIVPNPAEGLVIKTVEPIVVQTRKGPMRPVFKRKRASFAEDARFHGAQKWEVPQPGLTYAVDLLEWELTVRINANRVAAVASKHGRPSSDKELEALAQAVVEDAWDDAATHRARAAAGLSREEKELLLSVAFDAAYDEVLATYQLS